MKKERLPLFILALMCCGVNLFAQSQPPTMSFALDANRSFVYLKFDHYGRGVHFGEDESDLRLWFRFVNNCRVPVVLRTFGVPEGSLPHEIGVMDKVVRDEAGGIVVERVPPVFTTVHPGLKQFPMNSEKQPEREPHGYWFEVGSLESIAPGKDVLFSVPVNQFRAGWHVEIPFRFALLEGRGPRDSDIGGEPEMFLSYYPIYLPEQAQHLLQK